MHVTRVGLAPLKGTRHTAYDAVEVDRHGLAHDRELCLVDVVARRVLRTVEHPTLLSVVAERHADGLRLTLPTGESADGPLKPGSASLTCDYWGRPVDLRLLEGPHAALAAAHLGEPEGCVRLALAPRGQVVYGASVSLVATASLTELDLRVPGGATLNPARFRANLVVATDEAWVEEGWVGRNVEVGEAVLRLAGRIPRCAVVELDPTTGIRDRPVLRALAALRPSADGEPVQLGFGVDATVVRPGVVRPGDQVRVGRR